jgi:hypothetical protein
VGSGQRRALVTNARSALSGLALAVAMAAPVAANDAEVRTLSINPAACMASNPNDIPLYYSLYELVAAINTSKFALIICPFPITSVGNGGTSDIKISKFRTSYKDSDALFAGPRVNVQFWSMKILTNGRTSSIRLCEFDSNIHGSGSVGYTQAIRACNVTLQANTFYSFRVELSAGTPYGVTIASFLGIDFPP